MAFNDNSQLVRRVLTFVGLGVDNPCDAVEVSKEMEEKLKEFKVETQETINSLSARSFGTFLVTIAFLMVQFAAGAGLAVLDALIIGGIFGNILGTVSLLVGMVLASLTGSTIMLKYLAVDRLHSALEKRLELGRALDNELSQLIAYFRALARTVEDVKQSNVDDVVRALKFVKAASIKVGSEAGKISSGQKTIPDSIKIDSAQKDIDSAVNELTFGTFNATSGRIEKLQSSLKINIDAGVFDAQVPNPVGIVTYFKRLSQEIEKEYFSADLTPAERERNIEKVKNFMLSLIDELPTSVRRIAFIKIFEERAKKVYEYVPVEARAAENITEFINEQITIPDSIIRFFNTSVPQSDPGQDFDQNYNELSIEIRLAEAAIIGLPDYAEKVQFEAGVFKNMLLPAARRLSSVQREMTQYVNKDIESAEAAADISKKKMEWSIELSETKGLLKAAIGPSISFNGAQTYPDRERQIFNEANDIYKNLQTFISQKDDKADEVYLLAQRYLSVLALGSVSLFAPGVAASVLSGLQGIRFAVRRQLVIDEQEKSLAQTFLHKLEQSTFFNNVILPSWNQFMSSLQSSAAGVAIVGDLAKGDLSDLVNALEGVQKASIVNSALRCLSENQQTEQAKTQYDKLADTMGAAFEKEGKENFKDWYENFKKDSQQAIRSLRDKQAQLEIIQQQANA